MKVYVGAPAAARHYVEADRGRADDYYLAEGAGVARRFTAAAEHVTELAALDGDRYEAWVAGRDPDSGEPRGRLRGDDRAVRFVEVVVNGPKTWSLAAALHPDIAAAYEAAQDRAAEQILAWLSQHATTRVGPAGGQVQVPVEVLEAATVRHYTSRAEDPHRHLHLQLLSRVSAAGKWRGLHTLGVRDFLGAINGMGHAAMACDPELNAAFAAHGYTKGATGELLELAEYSGAFSARNAQIARNVDGYERAWRAAHPGEHPGPALRRAWDARGWAAGRPDKVTPRPGAGMEERWRGQLDDLGYRDPASPVDLTPTPIGALDRDQAVQRVLTRLAAGRSAWNPGDIRGEVERLIAAEGIITAAAVRIELAEDLTARALDQCVPLLQREGVPEHIRAWTSRSALDVEAELTARLVARAASHATIAPDTDLAPPRELANAAARLDAGQSAAVAALAGDRPLVAVEGAAGAGKTTTLAATRDLLQRQGRRLVVATPTLKAAKAAEAEVGAAAGSASRLAYQHGWRWNDDGRWTRLAVGEVDPVTGRTHTGPADRGQLRPGDLLVIDEAGMLDQDTARALLTVADECQARVALLGDRHQLAAVGRGGVLDLAIGQVDAEAHLTLEKVHRFTRTDGAGRTVPDTGYADLTLAMRSGDNPGAVFDALLERGQMRLHPDAAALQQALTTVAAVAFAEGQQPAVVVDTTGQAAELNAAIRQRLVTEGRVDDRRVAVTGTGERIGAGDRIATRRNDPNLDVANRDTWTVAVVGSRGGLLVTPAGGGPAGVTLAAAEQRVLPPDYVTAHVELAYATTAHGVQGDTVTASHVVIAEHTGAASAYVGMTRGRTANTAHLVATDRDDAREQWIAVFARDRADLGPAHAAALAAREAARYACPRPLDQVVADLHSAWTVEQRCLDRLSFYQPQRDGLRLIVALEAGHTEALDRSEAGYRRAVSSAEQARQRADASGAAIAAQADRIREALLRNWDGDRVTAHAAANVVNDGPGRLRLRRAAVTRSSEHLTDWANRWRPHLPSLPTGPAAIARVASRLDDRPALCAAFDVSARRAAERSHPEQATLRAAADAARKAQQHAWHTLTELRRQRDDRLDRFGSLARLPDPARRLADVERDVATTEQELRAARARITQLRAEPAILAQPADRLTQERDAWCARRDVERSVRRAHAVQSGGPRRAIRVPPPPPVSLGPRPGAGPHMGR